LIDNSLKRDYQVDTKCRIKFFFLNYLIFHRLKKRVIFDRFSLSKVDFRNWRTDFVVWGLVRFTLARISAMKIFRTLTPIVNPLQS